jgi:hypothetical protein
VRIRHPDTSASCHYAIRRCSCHLSYRKRASANIGVGRSPGTRSIRAARPHLSLRLHRQSVRGRTSRAAFPRTASARNRLVAIVRTTSRTGPLSTSERSASSGRLAPASVRNRRRRAGRCRRSHGSPSRERTQSAPSDRSASSDILASSHPSAAASCQIMSGARKVNPSDRPSSSARMPNGGKSA